MAEPFLNSESSGSFFNAGNAAKLAVAICGNIALLLNVVCDKFAIHRLQENIVRDFTVTLKKIRPVTPLIYTPNFKFNQHCSLETNLKSSFTVEWGTGNNIILNVPAIDPQKELLTMGRTKYAELKMAAINIAVENSEISAFKTEAMTIPYTDNKLKERKIIFPINSHRSSISLVAASLRFFEPYKNSVKIIAHRNWTPCDILDAAYFMN